MARDQHHGHLFLPFLLLFSSGVFGTAQLRTQIQTQTPSPSLTQSQAIVPLAALPSTAQSSVYYEIIAASRVCNRLYPIDAALHASCALDQLSRLGIFPTAYPLASSDAFGNIRVASPTPTPTLTPRITTIRGAIGTRTTTLPPATTTSRSAAWRARQEEYARERKKKNIERRNLLIGLMVGLATVAAVSLALMCLYRRRKVKSRESEMQRLCERNFSDTVEGREMAGDMSEERLPTYEEATGRVR